LVTSLYRINQLVFAWRYSVVCETRKVFLIIIYTNFMLQRVNSLSISLLMKYILQNKCRPYKTIQLNSHLSLWGATVLNTKLRTILKGFNLTPMFLTWHQCNLMMNEGNFKSMNIKRGFPI
jgi:hypothetical protein